MHTSMEMQEPVHPGEGSCCQLLWEEKWSLNGLHTDSEVREVFASLFLNRNAAAQLSG